MDKVEELSLQLFTSEQQALEVQARIIKETGYLQEQLKELQATNAKVREAIKEAMEATGTKKFENENIVLTYIAPSERVGVDLDKFRTHHPDLAEKFKKITSVKSSVRIKLKENK